MDKRQYMKVVKMQSMKLVLLNYFLNHRISLDKIVNTFRDITLTTDPEIVFQYRPATNKLVSNIAALFFSVIVFKGKPFVSTVPWKLGALLIHEFDHYQFFKENNLIGKEIETQRVSGIHDFKIEKRAFSSQIDFLENCKKNLPISTLETIMRVASWSLDGIPILDKNSSFKQVQKAETLQRINREIILLEADANIENLAKYQRVSRSSSIDFDRRVKNALSLNSKISGKKTGYPEIEMTL